MSYRPFDLSGQAALITGGNGGTGYGMAAALLQAGASVAIWGSLVRALAVELARYKIRVNSILPGWIVSEMMHGAIVENQRFADAVLPRIPVRRWGEKADFGGIAVSLASAASGYTTGEQFVIDGGYTKF